ncbi:unnamed protein product, partial [Meganyctiphanes norvegica]
MKNTLNISRSRCSASSLPKPVSQPVMSTAFPLMSLITSVLVRSCTTFTAISAIMTDRTIKPIALKIHRLWDATSKAAHNTTETPTVALRDMLLIYLTYRYTAR